MKSGFCSISALAGLVLTGVALTGVACSSTPPRERMEANLSAYQQAAGEPIDTIWFPRLQSWEPVGQEYVVIRTSPRDIYLLRVDQPCNELPWATALSITSTTNRIHARFDHVVVRDQRCRIREIREVDREALRQAQAAMRDQASGGT